MQFATSQLVVADQPVSLPEASVRVTVSVGGTTWGPGSPADLGTLIRKADKALYRAKAAGRNRVILEDSSTLELSSPADRETGGAGTAVVRDSGAASFV